ncbi:helix-turn-helix domain-containing protein [Nonomuraea sp. NPDC050153]|uniref:helix-turn-helix domain-containing protein n=1 Tax=Nonomuraea sp. NPDC050153 TaxID=3364359 RepID=UPI003795EF61
MSALAELLRALKERSGQSYADLSRRTYVSSSTLHRYCTGKVRIPDAGLVTRIARACGANEQEVRDAVHAWVLDGEHPPSTGGGLAVPAEAVLEETAAGVVVAAASPRVVLPRRRPVARAAAGVVVAALAIVLGTASSQAQLGTAPLPARPQSASGPSWVVAPEPVEPVRFGVTMNTNTGEMPGFRVGAVRFWDSQTRWANLEPRRGEYDWTVADRLVTAARRAGLPALFVIGGTPEWAAPDAPRMAYPEGARAAPPDDLADWDRFVRTLAGRYRGQIEGYELWPVGNDSRFYAGDVAGLVEMTRRASRAIKKADPGAIVVCPGMGRLWNSEGRAFLRRFAAAGGYAYCDVASVKLHQRSAADPPETMLAILDIAYRTLHQAGVHPPIWSTGTTHDIVLQRPLDEERAIDHAVRFYLTGLYGSATGDLRRTYFYAWGTKNLPVVLQAEGGAPTRAALAVEQLQRWLAHARVRACGQGAAIRLPANVWQCEFTIPDATGRHRAAVLRWTHAGTASTPAPPGTTQVHELDGTATPVAPGDFLDIDTRPVLVTGQ